MMTKTHELKCAPKHFVAIRTGVKTCEVRRADRDFAVGDVLVLREYDATLAPSGAEIRAIVTHVLDWPLFKVTRVDDDGERYVVMSIRVVGWGPWV